MTDVLALERISVRIGATSILAELNLSVGAGELVGLVGPNGAGKTTALRVAAGLQQPDSGAVRIGGRTPTELGPMGIARMLAYLPFGAECHWPLSVGELVALGRLPFAGFLRARAAADDEAITCAMQLAGVSAFAGRRVDSLSDGERARVWIARALAQATPVLLADEPTAALDPYHQLRVMGLLRGLAADGMAIVAVVHDLQLAAQHCHRIVLVAGGRAVASGAPGEVLTPERIRSAYGVVALGTGAYSLPI